jgi:HlyD family secretion protein
MIRRLFPVLIALLVFGAFGWTLVYLYNKSKERPIVYETAAPELRKIVKKTVAPGALVPRKEVAIKAHVSGVVEKLQVQPGQYVKEGALLARIQIIPDLVRVNQAEADLRAARLSFEGAKKEMDRARELRQESAISDADYAKQEIAFKLREQAVDAAENNLQLLRVGASKRAGKVSNLVHSTVEGMVLDVPVKEGASVIEANAFNEGTTIATVADMNDIIFQGRVDESEVGRLEEGMPVSITVGALDDQRFDAKLEYISPKGQAREGTIEFEVRAAVKLNPGVFIRSNYSANADIILERRNEVLSINEAWIVYEKGKAFVEVETAPQKFERRPIELGLSDGIWVEVKSGLDEKTRVKKLEVDWKAKEGAK